jgi:hypothetical protein
MKIKKQKQPKYSSYAIAIVIVFVIFFGYKYITTPSNDVLDRCIGYNYKWENFIDCYGVVSIRDGWDIDYLYLQDNLRDYDLAWIDDFNQFKVVDNILYVKSREPIPMSLGSGENATYLQKLFVNGELKYFKYESPSEIPLYLIVDTISGEAKAYKTIEDVPEEAREYFGEI